MSRKPADPTAALEADTAFLVDCARRNGIAFAADHAASQVGVRAIRAAVVRLGGAPCPKATIAEATAALRACVLA